MFKPTPYNFLAALTLIAGLIGLLDITDALPTFYLESQVRYLVKRATSNLPAVQVPPASNRQTPSSQLLVTADSLKGRPTELMSTDARKSQLAALGFAEPRNVAEWGEWFQQITKEYQGFSPSANSVIGDKNFGGLVRIFGFGIFMTVFTPFVMCCFCCCRTCCNTCGGKKPREEGYDRNHLAIVFGAFTVFTILNLSFAAIMIAYSAEFTSTLHAFEDGAKALVKDGAAFAVTAVDGLVQGPAVLTNVIQDVGRNLSSGGFRQDLNNTFYVSSHTIMDDMDSLGSALLNGKTTVNNTDALIVNMKARAAAVPGTMNTLANQVDAMRFITFNGTTWTIPGFPSSSRMRNISMPSLNGLPDVKSFASQFEIGNQLKGLARDGRDLYYFYVDDMPNAAKSLINTLINPAALLEGGITSANGTIQGLQAQSETIVSSISRLFADNVYPYDGYRHAYFVIQGLIVLGALFLAVLGVAIKYRKLMLVLPCLAVILSILLWLQFTLFYAVSAPFNIVCNSRGAVLNRDYRASELQAVLPSAPNSTIAVNPQAFIDSCRQGRTVFSANINSGDDTVISFAVDLINTNIGVIDGFIDGSFDVIAFINQADPTGALNNMNLDSLANFNFSAFNFPPTNASRDVGDNLMDVNRTFISLTPASFDPNRGNYTLMQQSLDSFNSYSVLQNGTFNPFTYNYIVAVYYLEGTTFSPFVVTSTTTNHAGISQRFYDAYWRIVFIYQAETAIASQRANATATINNIENVRQSQIISLENDYVLLQTTLAGVQTLVNNVRTGFNTLKLNVNAFMASLRAFAPNITYWIKVAVRYLIEGLLDKMLLNNPVEKFAHCQAVAEDVQYVLDGFCNNFINVLSGFWYDSMFLGIFLIFSFIATMMTKKRAEWLEESGETMKEMFGKTGKTGKKDANGMNDGKVATRAIIKSKAMNDVDGPSAPPSYDPNGPVTLVNEQPSYFQPVSPELLQNQGQEYQNQLYDANTGGYSYDANQGNPIQMI